MATNSNRVRVSVSMKSVLLDVYGVQKAALAEFNASEVEWSNSRRDEYEWVGLAKRCRCEGPSPSDCRHPG